MSTNTTAASGWICGRCGQHVAYGEMHPCFGIGPDDTKLYRPSPTELSLEDRVAKLETYVADLRGAVEELIKAMPVG